MKYAAIALHAITIAILIWVVAAFLQPKQVIIPPVQSGRAAPVTTPEVLKKDADGALQALSSLALIKGHLGRDKPASGFPTASSVTVALIGQAPVVDRSAQALRVMPKRNLTLVLQSLREPRAMIDGLLVKPGDQLPDNGRVAEINADRVVLIEKYGKQTLTLSAARTRFGAPTEARGN